MMLLPMNGVFEQDIIKPLSLTIKKLQRELRELYPMLYESTLQPVESAHGKLGRLVSHWPFIKVPMIVLMRSPVASRKLLHVLAAEMEVELTKEKDFSAAISDTVDICNKVLMPGLHKFQPLPPEFYAETIYWTHWTIIEFFLGKLTDNNDIFDYAKDLIWRNLDERVISRC